MLIFFFFLCHPWCVTTQHFSLACHSAAPTAAKDGGVAACHVHEAPESFNSRGGSAWKNNICCHQRKKEKKEKTGDRLSLAQQRSNKFSSASSLTRASSQGASGFGKRGNRNINRQKKKRKKKPRRQSGVLSAGRRVIETRRHSGDLH